MLQLPKPQLVLPQVHNLAATPVLTPASGTTVAASASINTKGSWVELLAAAAVTYDVYGITLLIGMDSASATVTRNLYDIGIGAAASEVVKIANILNTSTANQTNQPTPREYFFPIFIPKGTRISMRKQSNVASKTSKCMMFLHGGGGIPPWATFSGCDSYATDTATSGGLAHTPGNTGTYSTWTNIGATLSKDYGLIVPLIGSGSDTTQTSLTGYLQLGISSVAIAHYMYIIGNIEHMGGLWPSAPLYHRWVSGNQVMIRSTVSGTADLDYEYGFLAFY